MNKKYPLDDFKEEIYRVTKKSPIPLTGSQIVERIPEGSRATIYRKIKEMVDEGVLLRVPDNRYELVPEVIQEKKPKADGKIIIHWGRVFPDEPERDNVVELDPFELWEEIQSIETRRPHTIDSLLWHISQDLIYGTKYGEQFEAKQSLIDEHKRTLDFLRRGLKARLRVVEDLLSYPSLWDNTTRRIVLAESYKADTESEEESPSM